MSVDDTSAYERHLVERNPRYLEAGDSPDMTEWRRFSEEAFAPPRPEPRVLHEEFRELERELAMLMSEQFPSLAKRATELLGEMHLRTHKSGALGMGPHHNQFFDQGRPVVKRATPPPPDGWFWLTGTEAKWNGTGLTWEFLSDGDHLFGDIYYDGDPTISRFAGETATFELQAARRPPSASGRWRSAPLIELSGEIYGFTGVKAFPWFMGDKWCKCYLALRQTVFQLTSGGVKVLANSETMTPLLHEENAHRWNTAVLRGSRSMPIVEFALEDPALSVFVELDLRFDIWLEGLSRIAFWPGDNPMNSVVVRMGQWQVQAL